MATHFSTLALKTPWTEEPGGLQSTGSRRDGRVPCHQGLGAQTGEAGERFLTSGAAACSPLAGSVLGVGSEHGRGVDQAFRAGMEQLAASSGLGRGSPPIAWMPRGGSSGWTSQDRLCLRGRALSLPLSSLVVECPVTLGMICPKSQHKSLAQAGSAQRLSAGQPPPRSGSSGPWSGKGGPFARPHRTCVDGPSGLQGVGHGERQPAWGCGLPGEVSSSLAFTSGSR